MSAVTRLGPDLFRVDLQVLDRDRPGRRGGGPRSWFRSFNPQAVVVDPFLVTRSVMAVMDCCEMHSPSGRLLFWNEYRVFLAHEDHHRLRPLERILLAEMEPMLYELMQTRQAETVGDLAVRLLLDEGGEQAAGFIQVRVAFVPRSEERKAAEGEITIRIGQRDPAGWAPPRPSAENSPSTMRMDDPGPGVLVRWPGGEQRVDMLQRVVLGRPHDDAQGAFIPLTGASGRISRRHLWVEPQEQGVLLGRLSDANPVQVDGRLVQPGGSITLTSLPVQVSLSGGDLNLTLEVVGVTA